MKARHLLAVSAVIAWVIGLTLVLASGAMMAPMGLELTARTATLAHAQGALLIGLGVINWLSRRATDAATLRAVLAGNLVIQLLSLGVNARAAAYGLVTSQAWGAVVMHLVLAAGFAWFLLRPAPKTA
ncbi:MAG TPA: hypothetical protein VG389_20115 [Myxococcota bacterium]|jgi:hypothetical protein|nr:hypothetical protein [Myxococcota bacterium]